MLITTHDIDGLKRELGTLLPHVKSSHRVEAMARGLGFETNAALRAHLRREDICTDVNDRAFVSYLAQRAFSLPNLPVLTMAAEQVRYAEPRAQIQAVMAQYSDLSAFGFGVFQGTKSLAERKAEFDRDRVAMLSGASVEQFLRAVEYLAKQPRRKTINRKRTSYGLKHDLERYSSDMGLNNTYVTNGMFIAAAIHLGFMVERDGPNAMFNIAEIEARRNASLAQPAGKGARRKAWRNLLVTGINAGLAKKLFGLGEGENWWGVAREGIYRFEVEGRPAIASVNDAGHSELRINVAVNPTADAEAWIAVSNAGFLAGDGFASGWIERKTGKWLQDAGSAVGKFRRNLLPVLAAIEVKPQGYDDKGPFIL